MMGFVIKQIKVVLFYIDDKIFKGKLFGRLKKTADLEHSFLNKGIPHFVEAIRANVGRSVILRIPARDLLLMQFYYPMRSRSCLLAIHYIYIQYLEGENSYGKELELLFHKYLYGKSMLDEYRRRFEQYKINGEKDMKLIEVDRDLHLIDGSFRLALALYFKEDFVNVRCNNLAISLYRFCGKDFLNIVGYKTVQIDVIMQKMKELIDRCTYLNTCLLWTPARYMFDELVDVLRNYEPETIEVVDFFDVKMSFKNLSGFLKLGYRKDDCMTDAIRMKSDYMKIASAVDDDVYPLRIVRLKMRNPDYIVKPVSGLPYSQEALRCKETIRQIYKHRIKNYERDVIIHISDNYHQSNYIWELVNVNRDVTDFINDLHSQGIKYNVVSFSGDNSNNRYVFDYSTEAALILKVKENCVDKVLDIAEEFAIRHFAGKCKWWQHQRKASTVNIYLEGELIFAIRIVSDGK